MRTPENRRDFISHHDLVEAAKTDRALSLAVIIAAVALIIFASISFIFLVINPLGGIIIASFGLLAFYAFGALCGLFALLALDFYRICGQLMQQKLSDTNTLNRIPHCFHAPDDTTDHSMQQPPHGTTLEPIAIRLAKAADKAGDLMFLKGDFFREFTPPLSSDIIY